MEYEMMIDEYGCGEPEIYEDMYIAENTYPWDDVLYQ